MRWTTRHHCDPTGINSFLLAPVVSLRSTTGYLL